jgi:hypothetical protein
MGHLFLSQAWFDAVKQTADEIGVEVPAALKDLKINLEIKDVPHSVHPEGLVQARLDGGQFVAGLAADAPTKLKIAYGIAKKLFIDRDNQAAMQAFMSGQIQIEGDMMKMMQMQSAGGPTEQQRKLEEKIRSFTDVPA